TRRGRAGAPGRRTRRPRRARAAAARRRRRPSRGGSPRPAAWRRRRSASRGGGSASTRREPCLELGEDLLGGGQLRPILIDLFRPSVQLRGPRLLPLGLGQGLGLVREHLLEELLEGHGHRMPYGAPRCWRKNSTWTCSRARLSFGSGTMWV